MSGRIPSERALRMAAAVLALAGIGVATYIAVAERGSGSPVCLAGGGCETVANSRYADLAGASVAVIGIAGYSLLLISALVAGDRGRLAGFVLALIGFGFSAYLTYLELFVIDAICQWCLASAALMTLLLAVNATRALAYAAAEPTALAPGPSDQVESGHG